MGGEPADNIIYLDIDDDMASIKGRLETTRARSVVFVVPEGLEILHDAVHLKLLHRQAEKLGKQITLVSSEEWLHDLAHREGIVIRFSVEDIRAEMDDSSKPMPSASVDNRPRLRFPTSIFSAVIIVIVVLGLLAIPVVGGYFLIPSTTVILKTASESISDTFDITASLELQQIDPSINRIPAHIIELTAERYGQQATTGRRQEPETPAAGRITLINRSNERVAVLRGTRVGTADGVNFETADDTTLLPFGQARVNIRAVQPGTRGNVGKLAINRVADGSLAGVTVLNEEPTTGGTDKEVKYVTREDQARLRGRLIESLGAEGLKQLLLAKKPSESIYPQTLKVDLVEENFSPGIGEVADSLTLKVRASVRALVFEGRDVNDLVLETFEGKTRSNFDPIRESLKVSIFDARAWGDDWVTFSISAQVRAGAAIDRDKIKRDIAGLSVEEARSYLEGTLPVSEEPEIRTIPDWSKGISLFPWRISLETH